MEASRRLYLEYRGPDNNDEDKWLLAGMSESEKQAAEAGIATDRMMRKATLDTATSPHGHTRSQDAPGDGPSGVPGGSGSGGMTGSAASLAAGVGVVQMSTIKPGK